MPRVLLCGRPDLLTKPGGDTIQILGLQRHLGTLGQQTDLSLALRPRLDHIDLVHVFNLSRPMEPALQTAHAARLGRPVVLTPIYQDLAEYNRRGRHGAGRLLFRLLGHSDGLLETTRALINLGRSAPAAAVAGLPPLLAASLAHGGGAIAQLQAEILQRSDLVLFNSDLEEQTVRRCVPTLATHAASATVPVSIEPDELAALDPMAFLGRYGLQPGFVLCVGRIEDLKNQLGLIHALRPVPLQLILMRPINPLHRAYARAVTRAAARRPSTLVIHDLPRPLVLSAMSAAAVHVLPSWFETAGLTSLEAAAAGCAVVSTDRGYARALLGQDAHYCDPGDSSSIRRAVMHALEQGPAAALQRRVTRELSHARVAAQIRDLYSEVLAHKGLA